VAKTKKARKEWLGSGASDNGSVSFHGSGRGYTLILHAGAGAYSDAIPAAVLSFSVWSEKERSKELSKIDTLLSVINDLREAVVTIEIEKEDEE
jgi:hypothetical protein